MNFFKNVRVANRSKYLHPKAQDLLAEMIQWVEVNFGIQLVVTETVTTAAEDKALGRKSITHQEGRAFDIRSIGWTTAQIETFQEHFNSKFKFMGAISSKTGEPNLILYHNSGHGPHFHVQLAKRFAVLDMPHNLDTNEGIIGMHEEDDGEIPEGPWEAVQPNPTITKIWYVKQKNKSLQEGEIAVVFSGNEKVAKLLASVPDLLKQQTMKTGE